MVRQILMTRGRGIKSPVPWHPEPVPQRKHACANWHANLLAGSENEEVSPLTLHQRVLGSEFYCAHQQLQRVMGNLGGARQNP